MHQNSKQISNNYENEIILQLKRNQTFSMCRFFSIIVIKEYF